MQTTYSILTAYGRNKEAESLANGTPLILTEIAFGDGDRIPSGAETTLENELIRKPISAQGVVSGTPNASFFDALLGADDGPFVIREGGVFDQDGGMVAVIKYDPPINKPVAASGQNAEAQIRTIVAFSDLENLVLQIEAINAYVSAERRIDTGDGLDGGGDLSADRTLKLAFQGLGAIEASQVNAADQFAVFDESAGTHKKISRDEMIKLVLSGASIATRIVTADTLAKVNEEIWCDTSAGPVTVTLPAGAPDGATVRVFRDGPNDVIIARSDMTIMGGAEDFTIEFDLFGLHLRPTDGDWKHTLLKAGAN